MTGKRHAKPTAAQLTDRSYRKVIAIEKFLEQDIWKEILLGNSECRSGLSMLSARLESIADAMRPVIGHCERLLREKETLQRQLAQANKFMARPAPTLTDNEVVRRDFGEDLPCEVCGYYHYGRCPK